MKKELLEGFTEEQIARAKECKSQEELLAIAAEEHIELTDEQLDAIAGGGLCSDDSKDNENNKHRKIEN